MDCIFSVKEKTKELERIFKYLNEYIQNNSIPNFISNECGLPHSSYLYEKDLNIKKDSIINHFSTMYDDNLPYMKKKKEVIKRFWESNKDEITQKMKNIWGKYFLDTNYQIMLNLSRSSIDNLDDKIYDVCYKLTKQALLEECIYFICLKCFNNFFNEKLSKYNSINYKKLKILFGQIVANVLLRSEFLNKYKNRYPKTQYLLKIKCNNRELLEMAFETFCSNNFESFLLTFWNFILENYDNIIPQIQNLII